MVLGLAWLLLVAWVLAAILAAALPPEQPRAAADPYATEVAEFARELADWDRRGGR
jgi:hypothetical protein